MTWNAVRTAIICVILIILHYAIRPLIGWRALPDFLIIALIFGAVRMRPGFAALFGFLLGLASDSIVPGGFGAAALGMSLVGYGASWLKAVFFADNLLLNGFFIFLGKWIFDLVFLLVGHQLHGGELLMQIVVWSSLAAALTAVAGMIAIALLRPLMELRTA